MGWDIGKILWAILGLFFFLLLHKWHTDIPPFVDETHLEMSWVTKEASGQFYMSMHAQLYQYLRDLYCIAHVHNNKHNANVYVQGSATPPSLTNWCR